MLFGVLGPLEVIAHGQPVALRGLLQRATLGVLLLNANRVVATSKLVTALWQDEPPPTARKMLQNAVAGVRSAFRGIPAVPGTELVTNAPGYLLKVDPDSVDAHRFHALAAVGRAHLTGRAFELAAATLSEALALWRGPVLADLRESGLTWPEAAALDNDVLAVLEDYAEARLALNQHHEVLTRLEVTLADVRFPCRERMLGQFMIALYRAGRQADALGAYRRTRSVLVEEFGLDPSRKLQELERAILTHDPQLVAPEGYRVAAAPERAVAGQRPTTRWPAHDVVGGKTSGSPGDLTGGFPAGSPAGGPSGGPAGDPDWAAVRAGDERKLVTVLMLRVQVAGSGGLPDPEDLRETWRVLAETVAEVVTRFGGVLPPQAISSLWTAQFGVPSTGEDDAERAVLAGLELRRRLGEVVLTSTGHRLVVQIALATGEALVSRGEPDGGPAEVTGGILDTCLRLLTDATPGGLQICDTTQLITAGQFSCARPHGLDGWTVVGAAPPAAHRGPFVGRDRELQLLSSLLAGVRRHRRPHLATVLGEPGLGKSRLVGEFYAALASADPAVRCVAVRAPDLGPGPARGVLVNLVNTLLAATAAGATTGTGPEPDPAGGLAELCTCGRQLVVDLAIRRPLVISFEDLHRADDTLLDFIEDLIRSPEALSLLVLATARTELLDMRPRWGGGPGSTTTITLEPLPDEAMDRLLDALAEPVTGPAPDPGIYRRLVRRIGGNPYFAREYLRAALPCPTDDSRDEDPTPPDPDVPWTVHRLIAARIDTLPLPEKAILQAAAASGSEVSEAEVAEMAGRDRGEVTACLRMLERREFLVRVPHYPTDGRGNRYAFRHRSVRAVAYAQLPRHAHADQRERVIAGLGQG
jgi:DNA-binding SARP family transcriptional activator